MKTVSLVRGDDRYLCIKNALKLIRNDIEVEDKERILIKPNLTSPSNPYADQFNISRLQMVIGTPPLR